MFLVSGAIENKLPIIYPDLRLDYKLATLPFERRGNQLCLISLVKAIRARVPSLPSSLVCAARITFFYFESSGPANLV
jgi:hypothetical protein